ncbi:MAG: hypothetical protein R3F34_10645 [Planctomycetota bacterium]
MKQKTPMTTPRIALSQNVGAPRVLRGADDRLVGADRGVVRERPLPHRDAGDDPTDRAPQSPAEVAVAVGQVREQRVRERERRRVDQPVDDRQHEERRELGRRAEHPDERRADEVTDRREALRRRIPVGDVPRGTADDRADRAAREDVPTGPA